MVKPSVKLPFGQDKAMSIDSVNQLEEFVHRAKSWQARYQHVGPASDFYSQTVVTTVNDLKLTGSACSAMRTDVTAEDSSILCVPIDGTNQIATINGKNFTYQTHVNAVFCPEGRRITQAGERAVLFLDIDQQRLKLTFATMTGRDAFKPDLSIPHELNLNVGDVSFDRALRHLCKAVDHLGMSSQALALSNLDESFYRIVAMMFQPDIFLNQIAKPKVGVATQRVDKACEFMMGHLESKITLTDVERYSGLSARSLQEHFIKRFGVSPMAWLRDRRYERARQRLLHEPGISITYVAADLFFPSVSRFAAGYKTRFGELPSETVLNAGN